MTNKSVDNGAGGYDDGYRKCSCFWGNQPGSLLVKLEEHLDSYTGLKVLDAGCGEGKNASFLARKGAKVRAIDISELAINNGKRFNNHINIKWEVGGISSIDFFDVKYDLVIAYGLFHCFCSFGDVQRTVEKIKWLVPNGGYGIVCAFNDRFQSFSDAHPGFEPLLLGHEVYLSLFDDWTILFESDEDLHEVHPNNNVPHTHSMTRMIIQKEL